jgi:hypothetical protein
MSRVSSYVAVSYDMILQNYEMIIKHETECAEMSNSRFARGVLAFWLVLPIRNGQYDWTTAQSRDQSQHR